MEGGTQEMKTELTLDEAEKIVEKLKFCQDNPHLCQCVGCPIYEEPFEEKLIKLTDDMPREEYHSRRKFYKSVLHWGQRKLLINELLFLTRYSKPGMFVLYVGSAPGTHLKILFELFPRLKWILVDPRKFEVKVSSKIRLINDFFDDGMAEKYASKGDKMLFISDIRTGDIQDVMRDAERESEQARANLKLDELVDKDMILQMGWYKIMKPAAAMLKFRLPYMSKEEDEITYLDGEVWIQPWVGPSSTETRLVVTEDKVRKWKPNLYEDQMFYHNTVTRVSCWTHSVKAPGIDNCYDCNYEIFVLGEYLEKYEKWLKSKDERSKRISKMIQWISRIIGGKNESLQIKTEISSKKYKDALRTGNWGLLKKMEKE